MLQPLKLEKIKRRFGILRNLDIFKCMLDKVEKIIKFLLLTLAPDFY